ncbi:MULTISPECIES: hypothetical protein [unclassified Mesorhizobium]|uniref:hypothetical protein n=1 Tax=unclassified Mesorhizobium TaxID=325217 RepID=UPI0003CE566C|nr:MULTISPECIES: hypothetical protein [unclassified Mesorhizobium]ESY52073.1 hypothetical protein X745_20950 [Mesorhizobium sp. LNJC374B00]ESY55985.1 hypothetical protein X744_22420 [Mesorhizobium sp. LNJC372A00]WJI81268.1 hypothetical protein NLY34_00440 [Mesorhizobium sp. C374B]WJI87787.1 hypothetical protein NLY42_02855 [Mesorhizobium sp. C372A]
MAFYRIRKIKGNQYLYREERWREGKKVRSKSTLVRAIRDVTDFIGTNLRSEGKWLELEAEKVGVEKIHLDHLQNDHEALMAKLNQAYGLKMGPVDPVPEVEKGSHLGDPLNR